MAELAACRLVRKLGRLFAHGYFPRDCDAGRVCAFLCNHPVVIDALIEAYPHVQEHFGPSLINVRLEVLPADWGTREFLIARVVVSCSADEANARMAAFDDGWYLDQRERTNDPFNFNLEFGDDGTP